MADHFALPFTLGSNGAFATVDQDSDEDVMACVTVILRSRVGYRDDRPELGITDPTFTQGGADLEEIRDAISQFEPRSDRIIARDPEWLTGLIDHVTITAEGDA
jgi:hypothetical protein